MCGRECSGHWKYASKDRDPCQIDVMRNKLCILFEGALEDGGKGWRV